MVVGCLCSCSVGAECVANVFRIYTLFNYLGLFFRFIELLLCTVVLFLILDLCGNSSISNCAPRSSRDGYMIGLLVSSLSLLLSLSLVLFSFPDSLLSLILFSFPDSLLFP